MDDIELKSKVDEHLETLFAKAKETDKAEDLKKITEAIDIATKSRPVISENSGFNSFPWIYLLLTSGFLGSK